MEDINIHNVYKTPYGVFFGLEKDEQFTECFKAGTIIDAHYLRMFLFFIDQGTVVFDIGANCGIYVPMLSKQVGDMGEIHAFEPQRIIFQQLNCNIFINKCFNVHTYQVAVGNDNNYIHIDNKVNDRDLTYATKYNTKEKINFGAVSCLNGGGEKVPMIKIDSLDIKNNISLIKVDVQGMETLVFYGAKNTIKKHRPVIFFEYTPDDFILSEYLKQRLNLNDEIINFDIFDYCINTLRNYTVINVLNGSRTHINDKFLVPNEHPRIQDFIDFAQKNGLLPKYDIIHDTYFTGPITN